MHCLENDVVYEITRRNINRWDPISLIGFCPMDEYETEILEIVGYINDGSVDADLAMVIYRVFSKWFGMDFRQSLSDCNIIAQGILNDISNSESNDCKVS